MAHWVKKGVRRIMKAAIALLPLLALGLSPAATAAASIHTVQSTSAERLIDACARAKARLEALTASGAPLSAIRSPADAALLRDAFNLEAIRALPDDPETVLNAMNAVTGAFGALYTFAMSKDGGRSVLSTQDQLVDASLAVDLVTKRGFGTMTRFMASLPPAERTEVRRAGIRQAQAGYRQMFHGMLQIQSDPGLSAANRTRLIEGLFESVDVAVAALTLDDRAKIRTDILAFAGRAAPSTGARLKQLARLYERSDCTGLCAFSQPQG